MCFHACPTNMVVGRTSKSQVFSWISALEDKKSGTTTSDGVKTRRTVHGKNYLSLNWLCGISEPSTVLKPCLGNGWNLKFENSNRIKP